MSFYAYFCNTRNKGVCESWRECEAQITDKKTNQQKDGVKFAKFPTWRQAMAVVGGWEKKAKKEEKEKAERLAEDKENEFMEYELKIMAELSHPGLQIYPQGSWG